MVLKCVVLGALVQNMSAAAQAPEWAFPPCIQGKATAASNTLRLSVPGSRVHFTGAKIADWWITSDWFPQEHSPMAPIVAQSHSPTKAACGFCHLPDGSGRPENAKLAGLPATYIVSQLKAFHGGTRQPGQPDWGPARSMRNFTIDLPPAELAAAARYFAQQTPVSRVEVVENDFVPAHAPACFIMTRIAGTAVGLGESIVEMPIDEARFDARDPHIAYVAYVPPGSIERGRRLSHPCTACHGSDLKGGARLAGPPVAGRFASYAFRQLYAFHTGARSSDPAGVMRAVTAPLTSSQMIDLAAYLASLSP